MLAGFKDKTGYALSVFAYMDDPDKGPKTFTGVTKVATTIALLLNNMNQGTIVSPRGSNNFGWDPIFEVEDTGITFAEMTCFEKILCSPRVKAILQMKKTFDILNK